MYFIFVFPLLFMDERKEAPQEDEQPMSLNVEELVKSLEHLGLVMDISQTASASIRLEPLK